MNKIILVDQDGVIADTHPAAVKIIKERHDPSFSVDQWTRWDIADNYSLDHPARKALEEVWNIKNFFRDLPVMEGAVEGVNALREMGYAVFFCTSQVTDSDTCVGDKRDWIYKHFGRDWSSKLIITKDKTLVRGDYLIDDKPQIFGLFEDTPTWEHIVFDQLYNQDAVNKRRVLNWKDAVSFFEQELSV